MDLLLIIVALLSSIWTTNALIVSKQVPYRSAVPSSNIYPLKQDFEHGYNVKATPEACKDAAKVLSRDITADLKSEQIGNCKSHMVKYPIKPEQWIQIHHRMRYLSECPAKPPFFLKNVGPDQWSIYFLSGTGEKAPIEGTSDEKGPSQTATTDKKEPPAKKEPTKSEQPKKEPQKSAATR